MSRQNLVIVAAAAVGGIILGLVIATVGSDFPEIAAWLKTSIAPALKELQKADTWVKFASILLAPLTLGLVLLTWALAHEARKTRLQNKHPHVVVTIEPNKYIGFFDLVVENVGSGPAFDIHTDLIPDIVIKGANRHVSVSASSFLSLPILKPKQRFSQFLGRWNEFDVKRAQVTCKCLDTDGIEHSSTNVIDINAFESLSTLGSDNLEKIAQHLEKISRRFDQVIGDKRVQVDSYGTYDREQERAKWEEQRREYAKNQTPL